MRLAGGLAIFVTLLAPAVYFFLSYQYLTGSLDVQAEWSARSVTSIVTSNPETWAYEQLRLSELLARRPLTDAPQRRSIYDRQGRLVAEAATDLPFPVITRSRVFYDAGTAAGRVVVSQSVRPVAERTAAGAAAALIAAAIVYFTILRIPMNIVETTRRSLDKSETRYRSLYKSMAEGVAVFAMSAPGSEGPATISLVDANPSWDKMLGVRKDFGSGTERAGALGGALEKHVPEIVRRAGAGEGFTFEITDRDRVFAASLFFPEPGLFAVILNDLTETRKAQEEREQMRTSVLRAQKLESLGILAGGIAHDFNNLLVGILGNVDLALSKSPPDSAVQPYLRKIELAARRAAELTNQMLAYSGKGRFVVEAVDVSQIVGEMEQLLGTVVSKSAALSFDLAPGLPPIEADASQVRQVVMNLITNASDALGDREGSIRVTTGFSAGTAGAPEACRGGERPPGAHVYVDVADTGCGMDPGTCDRIFDPFFTTKDKGRGLGLAAAQGIVRGHRGTLSVRSVPGKGSTFRIAFPVAAGRAVPQGPPEAGTAGRPRPAGRGTILVVDDEESVRTLASDVLRQEGFLVLTASDGLEGVETFRKHPEIAAVVLDMTMPRMGGAEASDEMRRIAPGIPVILCSGYTEQDAVRRLDSRVPVEFVQKPYKVRTLLDKVFEVVGRRSGSSPGSITD